MDKTTIYQVSILLLCSLLALSIWIMSPISVQAQTLSLEHLQEDYRQAQVRSQQLNAQIATLDLAQQQVSDKLSATEQTLVYGQKRLAQQTQIVASLRARVRRDQVITEKFTHKVQFAEVQLRHFVQFWYEQGSLPYIDVLFGAHSFSDFLYRLSAMTMLMQQQKQLFVKDSGYVRAFHSLLIREQKDERQAQTIFVNIIAEQEKIAAASKKERQVIAHVEMLKSVTKTNRSQQIVRMQRLASQISAVEVEQARIAAQQAAKKAKAPQIASASVILNQSTITNDLEMAVADTGVSRSWVPWLLLLVRYESGGNPSAQSPVAVDGEHASGLLQMLPSTFASYALRSHNNIWSPVSNAIAAIRYIQANYGVPWNIPGIRNELTYRGY